MIALKKFRFKQGHVSQKSKQLEILFIREFVKHN